VLSNSLLDGEFAKPSSSNGKNYLIFFLTAGISSSLLQDGRSCALTCTIDLITLAKSTEK